MAEKDKKLDDQQDTGAENEKSEDFSKTILIYGVRTMIFNSAGETIRMLPNRRAQQ